jgi:hypothetical protein
MKKNQLNHENLEALINELIKEQPNQKLVKKIMIESGMPYHSDPINQMSQVLTVLNEKPVVNSRQAKAKEENEL